MSARHPQPPSQAELSAYADGELRGRRRRDVARHLAEDAESSALVAAYQRQDDLLRLGMKGLASTSISDRARVAGKMPRRHQSRRVFLAAAVVVALAGGSGGWWLNHKRNITHLAGELAEKAILAHLSYADAVVSAPPSRDAAALQLRDVFGGNLAVPDLSGFGLHLVALHEARGDGRTGILLRYAGADSVGSVSCYFAPIWVWGETGLASTEVAGVTAIYGIDDGIGYAVVGTGSSEELRRIAASSFRYASGKE